MADGTLTKRLVDFLCKGDFESEVDNFLQAHCAKFAPDATGLSEQKLEHYELYQKYIAIQAEHFDAFVAVEGGGLSEEALYTQLKQEQLLTANATTMAARYLKWVLSGLEYPAFLEMMVDYSAQFHDDDDDDDDEMDAEDEHERDLKDAGVLVESLSI